MKHLESALTKDNEWFGYFLMLTIIPFVSQGGNDHLIIQFVIILQGKRGLHSFPGFLVWDAD